MNNLISRILRKFRSLVHAREFYFLLGGVSFIAFIWPFLSSAEYPSPETLFIYFYSPWLILIIILFFISLLLKDSNQSGEE